MDAAYKQLTWESLKPEFVEIYSETFTDEEIKGLTEFYKTPLGQKLVEKMPEISAKAGLLIQKRMPAIMADLQKSVAESLQKAKASTPGVPNTGTPPVQ